MVVNCFSPVHLHRHERLNEGLLYSLGVEGVLGCKIRWSIVFQGSGHIDRIPEFDQRSRTKYSLYFFTC